MQVDKKKVGKNVKIIFYEEFLLFWVSDCSGQPLGWLRNEVEQWSA